LQAPAIQFREAGDHDGGHAVHIDCENPLRLVFIEQWADRAALMAHFAMPASRDFVRALQPLAAASPTLEIYDATRLEGL
jgi:quinol monooxygenase YgiN